MAANVNPYMFHPQGPYPPMMQQHGYPPGMSPGMPPGMGSMPGYPPMMPYGSMAPMGASLVPTANHPGYPSVRIYRYLSSCVSLSLSLSISLNLSFSVSLSFSLSLPQSRLCICLLFFCSVFLVFLVPLLALLSTFCFLLAFLPPPSSSPHQPYPSFFFKKKSLLPG